MRHSIGVAHRGREAEPLDGFARKGLEPRETDTELPAALGSRQVVNLVHHHGLDRAEHGAQIFPAEHELERFGRGDHEVGRLPCLLRSLRLRGVAVANIDPEAHGLGQFGETAVNVTVQCPKGVM